VADAEIIRGPWKPRRSLAQLAVLTGGNSAGVVVEKRRIDPSLMAALGAKYECFASLAKSLADESNALQRGDDAAILQHIASLLETRAASIELDLEIFD